MGSVSPRHRFCHRSALSLFTVISCSCLLAGCEKSTGAQSTSEVPAPAETAKAKGAQPEGEGTAEETPGGPRALESEPEGALETDLPKAEFAEGIDPKMEQVFESLRNYVSKHRGKLYAAAVDLETNKWLVKLSAETMVNPASNAKLLTAAAALELLGPAYQFSTELFGDVNAEGHSERLVLRGGGAPDLTTADLWRLIRVAKGEGLISVGSLVVDQSRFTEEYVPPAFEQQPKEWAPFRAPVSALSLNRNTLSLNVIPRASGADASVWFDPPGVVKSEGAVKTSAKGNGDLVGWTLSGNPQYLTSQVSGTLAEGLGRRRYSRRFEDPRLVGGYALSALLKEAGVKVNGSPTLGVRQKESRIAVWNSEPVAELVRELGKESDNFTAEMLFIALSAKEQPEGPVSETEKQAPWSSLRGAKVTERWLTEKKIPLKGVVIKNGSGLFDANRVSAEVLAQVLAAAEDNPRVYQEFVSQLAMGATDGTLRGRMKGHALAQRVRAKTGTINGVDALSGYIQRAEGRSPVAFSIIVDGPKASHAEVRAEVDKVVLKWAELIEQK